MTTTIHLKHHLFVLQKQHINGLLQQAVLLVKSLEKPSPEIIEFLKNVYSEQGTQTTTNSASIFGSAPTAFKQNDFQTLNNSIFAQTNQNLFGTPSVQSQPFSNTTGSMFGVQNADSKQVPNQNIFAQANANIGLLNSGSIFSNQRSNTTTSNTFPIPPLFGQANSQSSIFGYQNNILQQPTIATTPNIFGTQTVQQILPQSQQATLQIANSFGANPSLSTTLSQETSIFNSPSFVTSTPRQQPQQVSIFGNQPTNNLNNSPLFQTKNADTGDQGTNIFINNINEPQYHEGLYSRLAELTTEEINWFQSDAMDPMTIPDKPPTFEMSFKA